MMSSINFIFLWMGERENISPLQMIFAGKKHFIVWSYLPRPKLKNLSPHSFLKLELRVKKLLVCRVRAHNSVDHFFKFRLS